jgi:type VI secretion system protein ImpA
MAFDFDIEKLLSPLSADHPAGESLRFDGTYDKIREARKEDDPNLPQGAWKTELRKAQWTAVESIAIEALETRSKDLQIAAWLTEAWLKLHGFAGAAKGFELMHALAEGFWDDLYPAIENGDLEFRMAPLAWINEKLSVSIKLLPITQPDSPTDKIYCFADLERAAQLDNAMHRPGAPKALPPNSITTALIQRSAMLTPTLWFRTTQADIHLMQEALALLDGFIDSKAGKAAPGFPRFTAATDGVSAFVEATLQQRRDRGENVGEDMRGEMSEDTPIQENAGEFDNNLSGPESHSAPGRIRDRAEAYYLLAEAADYLARTEPHSPTPYLVRRAIAWGSMSLEQLLPEMIRNGNELQEIFRLLQIR